MDVEKSGHSLRAVVTRRVAVGAILRNDGEVVRMQDKAAEGLPRLLL